MNSILTIKKVSHFIQMGTLAFLMASSVFADNIASSTSKYQGEMKKAIKQAQDKGYLNKDIKIQVKEVNANGIYKPDLTASNQSNILAKQCEVIVSISKSGDTVLVATDKDIQDKTNPQNNIQKKMAREFILLHEASHCEFSSFKDVFLIDKQPELQKDVNYYFKHMVGNEQTDSMYSLLNENFADTYASIQLIKLYGANKDVLHIINKTVLERQDTYLTYTAQEKLDSHFTHMSLIKTLKEENIEKINITNKSEALKRLALEIANIGTKQILAQFPEHVTSMLEKTAMINSTFSNAEEKSIQYFINNESSKQDTFFSQLGDEALSISKVKRKFKNNQAIALTQEQELNLVMNSKNVFEIKFENKFEEIEKITISLKSHLESFKIKNFDTEKHKFIQEFESRELKINNIQNSNLIKKINIY